MIKVDFLTCLAWFLWKDLHDFITITQILDLCIEIHALRFLYKLWTLYWKDILLDVRFSTYDTSHKFGTCSL